MDEFAELLTWNIEHGTSEKLIIWGDFNMPGVSINSMNDRLSTLLDVHGYQQHVTEPTRGHNQLDLVMTPTTSSPQPFMSSFEIVSSHDLSNHNLVVGDPSMQRYEQTAISYVYRNLKNMDVVDFEQRFHSSQLFIDPVDTPDEYLNQLESAVTAILDEASSDTTRHKAGDRMAAKWLEPEAVSAK